MTAQPTDSAERDAYTAGRNDGYTAGWNDGFNACKSRVALVTPPAVQPAVALPLIDRDLLIEVIAEALSGTLHCTREWSAWSVQTMREDDFSSVEDSETPSEVADAVISAISAYQAIPPAVQPVSLIAEEIPNCPMRVIEAIGDYGDARADGLISEGAERFARAIALIRKAIATSPTPPAVQPVTPAQAQGDCGNGDCNWRGFLTECSYLGAVGPLCPNCREIVEADAVGAAPPAAQVIANKGAT